MFEDLASTHLDQTQIQGYWNLEFVCLWIIHAHSLYYFTLIITLMELDFGTRTN